MKARNTLLGLLGAGLIYAGCGEEFSSHSSSKKIDVVDAQEDTPVDTYDLGIDTLKRDIVKVDTAYDTSVDTTNVKKDTYLDTTIDTMKDTLGLETEVNEAYTAEAPVDTYEVSVDATGDAEEETNADVYQIVLCSDMDKDGFFGNVSGEECYVPSGKDEDCDDNDKLVYPGAAELCDGIDNGCNGLTDEDLPDQSYYTGAAETLGVGICKSGVKSCVDGKMEITTLEVTTSLVELCDGLDNNCNTFIDEGQAMSTFYLDNDGDGFGDLTKPIVGCTGADGSVYSNGTKQILNYIDGDGDCDDNNKSINPGASEQCNGIDDNCNGSIDDNAMFLEYFFDGDMDGYGSGTGIKSCVAFPAGYVTNNTDCNNTNAAINPAAVESCNGIDDDCNDKVDDGLEQAVQCGYNNNGTKTTDCVNGTINDKTSCTDPDECKLGDTKACEIDGSLPGFKCELDGNIYLWKPTESEDTGKYPDGKDNNCNGQVDENYSMLVPAGTYVAGCDYPAECNYAGNPVHEVNTPGFYISTFEFTQKQAGKSGNLPEINVNQTDAESYCVSLGGRLPTKDEWEIAAKGGKAENNYPWAFLLGNLLPACNLTNSWYCSDKAEEVGSYPNDKSEFGAYDMGGNVSEWTSTLGGAVAFVKGGNWKDGPEYALVYYEQFQNPATTSSTLGFRCVLDKIN